MDPTTCGWSSLNRICCTAGLDGVHGIRVVGIARRLSLSASGIRPRPRERGQWGESTERMHVGPFVHAVLLVYGPHGLDGSVVHVLPSNVYRSWWMKLLGTCPCLCRFDSSVPLSGCVSLLGRFLFRLRTFSLFHPRYYTPVTICLLKPCSGPCLLMHGLTNLRVTLPPPCLPHCPSPGVHP